MNDLTKIDDTFDKIEKYYRSSGGLLPKEKEICERWELSFALLSHHKNKKVAVSKYITALKSKGTEVSVATAYRDLANAERLFVPLKKYSKEFLRLILIESALRDIKKAEQLAAKTKDPKLWAEIMKTKDKAELRIIKASGLDVDDPNLPDFSKLQFSQINIDIDPSMKTMFQTLLKNGTVDVTQLFNTFTDATILDNTTEES